MPTQVIIDARITIKELNCGYHEHKQLEHLIDLVEEYGDALLSIGRMGSESFRKNGTEVDPKACVEWALRIRNDLSQTVMRLSRKGDDLTEALRQEIEKAYAEVGDEAILKTKGFQTAAEAAVKFFQPNKESK